jgi:hypothetical protein
MLLATAEDRGTARDEVAHVLHSLLGGLLR